MSKCLRCAEWQRQGLSDTCPTCDQCAQAMSYETCSICGRPFVGFCLHRPVQDLKPQLSREEQKAETDAELRKKMASEYYGQYFRAAELPDFNLPLFREVIPGHDDVSALIKQIQLRDAEIAKLKVCPPGVQQAYEAMKRLKVWSEINNELPWHCIENIRTAKAELESAYPNLKTTKESP